MNVTTAVSAADGAADKQLRPLLWMVVASAGRGRAALVAATTAVLSGLLLVAVSILRLPSDSSGYSYSVEEQLFGPIADPGTRAGVVVAIILVQLPVLLLLDQAVRLGSTNRHRRYAALAVAGATRQDLRQWGMVEIGVPALAGAVLGVSVWWVLRELLGDQLSSRGVGALVPTTESPGPWSVVVIAMVAAYGVGVGYRAGSQMTSLLAGSRGVRRPPRPWGLLVLLLALILLSRTVTDVTAFAVVLLLAGGSPAWRRGPPTG